MTAAPRTQALAALYYAAASALIMLVNKLILFTWGFPSPGALALSQCVFTVAALRLTGVAVVHDTLRRAFPLPVLFLVNAVSGLAGTGALSIPMFTVLRRTNLVLTMSLESWLLGVRFPAHIKLAVAVMMAGALLATAGDLGFDARGYALVALNNIATSLLLLLQKRRGTASTWELMYANCLVSVPLLSLYLIVVDREGLHAATVGFAHWRDPTFCLLFFASSALGTVLQHATMYCTQTNSALATVVTGVLKNTVTTYAGMGLGYTFSPLNFAGVTVSMLGGVGYAYATLVPKATESAEV